MGCWNQTCAISNLHILNKQDVVIFPLIRQNHKYEPDLCNPNSFYQFTSLPFYAKYDEYGGADNCHGVGLDIILDNLKEKLVEKIDSYTETDVTKENFNIELFFEACHQNRMYIGRPFDSKEYKVEFVMIHRHIFDAIINNTVYHEYIGGEELYITFKFADVLADLPEWVSRAKNKIVSYKEEIGFSLRPFLNPYHDLFTLNSSGARDINLANLWLKYMDREPSSLLIDNQELISNALLEHTEEEATAIIAEYLKGKVIYNFSDQTRKIWTPQCGTGSQSSDHDGYRLLIKAMTEILDYEENNS